MMSFFAMLGYRARSLNPMRAMSLATEGFSAMIGFMFVGDGMVTRTLSVGDTG